MRYVRRIERFRSFGDDYVGPIRDLPLRQWSEITNSTNVCPLFRVIYVWRYNKCEFWWLMITFEIKLTLKTQDDHKML